MAWNSTGKKLWRRADPAETIEWRQPAAARGSLRPAAPRATTLGGIGGAGLQHDPESGSAASARAQRAAEAARPSAPRALELVAPAAVDRLARGSGWGNVPRPLARCCMAEQSSLDGLQPRRRQLRYVSASVGGGGEACELHDGACGFDPRTTLGRGRARK